MVHEDDAVLMPTTVKIFRLRGLGYSQAEIANRISVSQQTVSYYLRLMKSKSDLIGPDKYFRSLLPYFSESTVNHAEVFEKIKKELHEEREKDRMELNKEMDSIIKYEKKNQKDIKMLEDKSPFIPAEVSGIIKRVERLSEQYKIDIIDMNKEMDSIIKFEKKNQKDIKILEDELNRLSELVNNSGVNRRRS